MRLYYGGYGHHPSGKQYVYVGGDNYRTNQNVVAPVTNPHTGRTYNTMFTIQRTSNIDSNMAQGEIERLQARGIEVKSLDGRNVMGLPGAGTFNSAKAWRDYSNEEYDARHGNLLSYNQQADTTQARNNLMSY